MKASQFYLSTLKEAPQDAELKSHQLMIRAGFIKRLSSGLYSWMPLGLRVLKKVENIIREEMNKAGGIELLMPAIQPSELWNETQRWDLFGPQMLKIKDRHDNDFCFGPTHEEVITDIVRKEIKSYKQLPVNFYQIQTKFRDEIRPRFGVMRAREFLMKDSYSFHANDESLQETYKAMFEAYNRIFTQVGLNYRSVAADSGAIGGDSSHEFHVLADSGEDLIAFSDQSEYAANIEKATTQIQVNPEQKSLPTAKIPTPSISTINNLVRHFQCNLDQILKSIAFVADGELVICFLAGNREINLIKLQKTLAVEKLHMAKDADLEKNNLFPGFIGPQGIDHIRQIFDHSVLAMKNMICGANESDYHLKDFNFQQTPSCHDISNVIEGDLSPDGKGQLKFCRGIEVGHIFQLGKKYSEAMGANFLDEQGVSQILTMGCYGIGVSRIVAAAVEQNNDDNGMILPQSIAPFEVIIIPIGMNKSDLVKNECLKIYHSLKENNFDVLLDDRDLRPGIMFAESDLIGIPHRIVVGEKSLNLGEVEYKRRKDQEAYNISLNDVVENLKKVTTKTI
jgi:prolyl-tRNA synthetase